MTRHPTYRTYVQGKLALAGIDLSAPATAWLDAAYAAWVDAPHAILEKLLKKLAIEEAKLDPQAARATWGRLPEHQVLSSGLMSQQGGVRGPARRPAKAIPQLPNGRERRRPS